MLQAVDPYAPKGAVCFDPQHRAFRHEPSTCHTLNLYAREGSLLLASEPPPAPTHPPLRNSFNFCDRSMQTAALPPRTRATATQDVPRANASTAAAAAAMHDTASTHAQRTVDTAVALVERLTTHNSQRDVLMDFKVPCIMLDLHAAGLLMTHRAQYREESPDGTLLPLWDMRDIVRGKAVTALAWHPSHPTLLAVAYGSQDFQRQMRGAIACWSLQQPARPERLVKTACGTVAHAHHMQDHMHTNIVLLFFSLYLRYPQASPALRFTHPCRASSPPVHPTVPCRSTASPPKAASWSAAAACSAGSMGIPCGASHGRQATPRGPWSLSVPAAMAK